MKKLLIISLIFLTGFTRCSLKRGATVCESLVLQRSFIISDIGTARLGMGATDSLIKIYCNCDNQIFKK